jgi:threonine/homoserine/homoserine lactone efflux protein
MTSINALFTELWCRGRAQSVLNPKQIQRIYLSFHPAFIPKNQNVASNIITSIFSNHVEALYICWQFAALFTLMLLRENFLIFRDNL